MKMHRVKIDPNTPDTLPEGRVDESRLDSTTERDIEMQQYADDIEALRESAVFARRVRKRLGLNQEEFSRRIDVPVETIRKWEQGKQFPVGPAKTLLKVLDKSPETVFTTL